MIVSVEKKLDDSSSNRYYIIDFQGRVSRKLVEFGGNS
ncbi:hypothetical protein L21SP2_0506 [Salinispira pacifica]|uniref:Uncharacterized protein n=1 Tax=Salinispira pacifica TaxID=1307761 RepID=V5WDQ2_9SPIO|nr:hypothetical protein L21SP2_0506 [Salinispira pacifica]